VEEICPSEGDALWALNVKRGVLSAFQNSMSRLDSDQQVSEVRDKSHSELLASLASVLKNLIPPLHTACPINKKF
jgi:hypothetical protein